MLPLVARWFLILAAVAVAGLAGAFLGHEAGQGRTVPTVAGGIFGGVFGLGMVGVRTRLFDALFPPRASGYTHYL